MRSARAVRLAALWCGMFGKLRRGMRERDAMVADGERSEKGQNGAPARAKNPR